MSTLFISTINTLITEEYLRTKKENQYFERKGLGDKDMKPANIAEELIGMLNSIEPQYSGIEFLRKTQKIHALKGTCRGVALDILKNENQLVD